MNHQIELGYLVLELPEPDTLTPVLADVVGLIPGEPAAGARTWRDDGRAQRLVVQPGPANDAVAVGFEAVDVAAFDADRRPAPRDRGRHRRRRRRRHSSGDGSTAWRARPRRGASTIELVLGLADAATPYSSPLVPGGFLTEGVGFGHVVFATTAFDESVRFLTEGLGPRAVRLARDRAGARDQPRGPVLPLQRAAPHRGPRSGTVRAPAVPPSRDVRGELPRRRRGRVRPRVGCRPADPERARASRQRRDVQLLPADPRRLPDRVRPRRSRRRRRLGRQPSVQPHQRLGPPAAARP